MDSTLDGGDRHPHQPEYWCDVCSLDLQSSAALAQHRLGRKHVKREYRQSITAGEGAARPLPFPRSDPPTPLDEAELFQGLASGRYRNVVVLTGAGVSTAAGVPDFRSPGGAFDVIRQKYGNKIPQVYEHPEYVLSRSFALRHPELSEEIRRGVLRPTGESMAGLMPTETHKFCAWLHRRGALRRVYTQNIDGLHLHPSLGVPTDLVVECHGSLVGGSNLVMYGDDLPRKFYRCCDVDFSLANCGADSSNGVDLVLVFGTSLQVAPFCGVPNMAPRGSARVLVNRDVDVCLSNSFSRRRGGEGLCNVTSCRIGARKSVRLGSLWTGREGNKKWRQLLVEDDCDAFVERFFNSDPAREALCDIDV